MKKIDSDALGDLTKALGLTGRGAPVTELTDGIVDQALEVGPIIRRGRTLAGSQGIFTAILQNEHTDAETISNSIDPYKVPAAIAIPPYPPSPMPAQFDVWLLRAAVRRVSGSSTLRAVLQYQYPPSNQGWGVTDSGVAVVSNPVYNLAYWDAVIQVGTGNNFGGLALAEQPLAQMRPFRLPRNVDGPLIFISISSLTSVFQCQLVLGVFPIALGQDGIV